MSIDQALPWMNSKMAAPLYAPRAPAVQQPQTVRGKPPLHHFAFIYIDPITGSLMTKASESLCQYESQIFNGDFKRTFLDCSKGRPVGPPPQSTMCHKRSRVDSEDDFDDDEDDGTKIPLEIGNTKKVLEYYDIAFRAFQQINCRQIAKAYIKLIEPRKQVKHPYNGGKTAPGEKADPEKTKPDWWPAGVVHKEPDHLKKPERIRLLIHILRNLRSHGFDVRALEEAGLDVSRQIKPADRLDILNEVHRVRRMEEALEDGLIDEHTVIFVTHREPPRDSGESLAVDEVSFSGIDLSGMDQDLNSVGQKLPQNSNFSPPPAVPFYDLVNLPVDIASNHSFSSHPDLAATTTTTASSSSRRSSQEPPYFDDPFNRPPSERSSRLPSTHDYLDIPGTSPYWSSVTSTTPSPISSLPDGPATPLSMPGHSPMTFIDQQNLLLQSNFPPANDALQIDF